MVKIDEKNPIHALGRFLHYQELTVLERRVSLVKQASNHIALAERIVVRARDASAPSSSSSNPKLKEADPAIGIQKLERASAKAADEFGGLISQRDELNQSLRRLQVREKSEKQALEDQEKANQIRAESDKKAQAEKEYAEKWNWATLLITVAAFYYVTDWLHWILGLIAAWGALVAVIKVRSIVDELIS